MIIKYIEDWMRNAHYELIEDESPYYGEIEGIKGVWATGRTHEECRENLRESFEDWIVFSIS